MFMNLKTEDRMHEIELRHYLYERKKLTLVNYIFFLKLTKDLKTFLEDQLFQIVLFPRKNLLNHLIITLSQSRKMYGSISKILVIF